MPQLKKSRDTEVLFNVVQEFGICDERGHKYIALREVSWSNNKSKIELRTWVNEYGEEKALKGVSFLTDEGPDNLALILIKAGFGDTKKIADILKTRDSTLVFENITDDEATLSVPAIKQFNTKNINELFDDESDDDILDSYMRGV